VGLVTGGKVLYATAILKRYLLVQFLFHLELAFLVGVMQGAVAVVPLRPSQSVKVLEHSGHPFVDGPGGVNAFVMASLEQLPSFGGEAQQQVVPSQLILLSKD